MKTFDNLGKNEAVVTQAKIHWACLIPHIILIPFVIGFVTIIPPLIGLLTTQLVLTSRRVCGKTGLINTKSMDTPLNKVNTISVESGLGGKIFGYGTIHITSSSGGYDFKYIKSPSAFRDAVVQEIDRFDEDRIKKQAAEMASAIKT